MFVYTVFVAKLAFGTRYGPGNSAPTAAALIIGHGVGYAPQSDTKSTPTAWITPSASSATLTSACSWRDLPAAIRFSRRSSTHFTGAPSLRPASIRHISSRCTRIFWPKPPPVSRITTRMRCSGMPSNREQNSRTSCGDCVAEWIVRSPVLGE